MRRLEGRLPLGEKDTFDISCLLSLGLVVTADTGHGS